MTTFSASDLRRLGAAGFQSDDPERAMLQARIQAAFTAHLRAKMVRFGEVSSVKGANLELIPIQGPGAFRYTAIVVDRTPGEAERFYVARSKAGLRFGASKAELAGPFTTLPFPSAPANTGTPPAAMLWLEDVLRAQNEAPSPKTHRPKPMRFPPGVPVLPLTLGARRSPETPAMLGVSRGYEPGHQGARLAA